MSHPLDHVKTISELWEHTKQHMKDHAPQAAVDVMEAHETLFLGLFVLGASGGANIIMRAMRTGDETLLAVFLKDVERIGSAMTAMLQETPTSGRVM